MVSRGFQGFVSFSELASAPVPSGPGVYAILTPPGWRPDFLATSPAGRFKGRDPSVPPARLRAEWVDGPTVIYIGKASGGATGRRGLKKRLDEFRRFGEGDPIGHWGGRLIWQLGDSRSLLVCWKETSTDPATLESAMIKEFATEFGRRPFANLRN